MRQEPPLETWALVEARTRGLITGAWTLPGAAVAGAPSAGSPWSGAAAHRSHPAPR